MENLIKATQGERKDGPFPLIRDKELYKLVGRDNKGNKVK